MNQVWTVSINDAGGPIAQSSPNVATLDGNGPSVVVGDRSGQLIALHLSDGSAVPGFGTQYDAEGPIDSTPSVAPIGIDTSDDVFVGRGNAADPDIGGYYAYGANGNQLWSTQVHDPDSDQQPNQGVQASLSVGQLQPGVTSVIAGSLDQEEYAMNATTGSVLSGWPYFTADSVFSTASLADLYGHGNDEIVEGGDSSTGFGNGQDYSQGGHLRILNADGNTVCQYNTDQVVQSSPAVGDIEGNGQLAMVVGTGSFFSNASDTDTLFALDNQCHQLWSDTLDGSTFSSPALGAVIGDGSLQVAEGTDTGTTGSVWLMQAGSGQVLWHTPVIGRVIGSVALAPLGSAQEEDVVVPTTAGVEILDGQTGEAVATFADDLGFQNAPLITADPNGTVGITVAGYNGDNQGVISHFEVAGSNASYLASMADWPQFHHDPQLTGTLAPSPATATTPCSVPSAADLGSVAIQADGTVRANGSAPLCGSLGGTALNSPIVAAAASPSTGGYWLAGADGGVFAFGRAQYYGGMGGTALNSRIVAMAATPDGGGYWLTGADGGIFAFGDAQYYGSLAGDHLDSPIVAVVTTPDGKGYRLVSADGGVFDFGDAQYFGALAGHKLNSPIVTAVDDTATGGYWLFASDGGVFSFHAAFAGSLGNVHLAQPISAAAEAPDGSGYVLLGADGGIFSFGAPFYGSFTASSDTSRAVALLYD